jgi:hypothetical protein
VASSKAWACCRIVSLCAQAWKHAVGVCHCRKPAAYVRIRMARLRPQRCLCAATLCVVSIVCRRRWYIGCAPRILPVMPSVMRMSWHTDRVTLAAELKLYSGGKHVMNMASLTAISPEQPPAPTYVQSVCRDLHHSTSDSVHRTSATASTGRQQQAMPANHRSLQQQYTAAPLRASHAPAAS